MICNYEGCTSEHEVERTFHTTEIPYCEEHDPVMDERVCGFLKVEEATA
jgi:hypothetical protein